MKEEVEKLAGALRGGGEFEPFRWDGKEEGASVNREPGYRKGRAPVGCPGGR